MPHPALTRSALWVAALGAALTGAMSVPRTPPPEAFPLGRDANGEPCSVSRNWRDDRLGNPFDKAWAITCRGVTAARAQGWLLAVKGGQPLSGESCGAPTAVRIEGIGEAEARACFDPRLALPVVRLQVAHRGVLYTARRSPPPWVRWRAPCGASRRVLRRPIGMRQARRRSI
jgi:hypothetical protein